MPTDQNLREIFLHALREEYGTDDILHLPDGQIFYLTDHLQLTQGPQNNIHVLNRLQMNSYTVSSESLQIPLRDGLITPEPYTPDLPDGVMQSIYHIAGTTYLTQDQKHALKETAANPASSTISLVAEPDNIHDPQAIAIHITTGGLRTNVGYIPATSTRFVHPSLAHDMAPVITRTTTSYGTDDYSIALNAVLPDGETPRLTFQDATRLRENDLIYIPASPHPLRILDILPTAIPGKTYPRLIIGNRLSSRYAVSMRYLISNHALYHPCH